MPTAALLVSGCTGGGQPGCLVCSKLAARAAEQQAQSLQRAKHTHDSRLPSVPSLGPCSLAAQRTDLGVGCAKPQAETRLN